MKSIKPLCSYWLLLPIIFGIAIPYVFAGVVYDKIEEQLQYRINETRNENRTYDIIVEFNKSYISSPASIAGGSRMDGKQAFALRKQMMAATMQSQAGLMKILRGHGARQSMPMKNYRLWITNEIFIPDATKEIILEMADDKADNANITVIREQSTCELAGRVRRAPVDSDDDVTSPWAFEKIGRQPWMDKGFDGTGVVVGHIDTGVNRNNEFLRDGWLGPKGGWLDPFTPGPYTETWDSQAFYHGTKTLAIAVGKEVGVAPGARWTSCMGCYSSICQEGVMKMCAQFMVCPYDVGTPTNQSCMYRPRIVLCPWSCGVYESRNRPSVWEEMIRVWRSVGIIAVFPAGNDATSPGAGDGHCNSISVPADMEEVLTVGSVDKNDTTYSQSGIGPPANRYGLVTSYGIYKPEIVAPGVNVYTGMSTGDKFNVATGTSYAAAHVAGSIALLLSRNTNLNFGEVKDILTSHAKKNFIKHYDGHNVDCGKVADNVIPNHKIGHGRLNLPEPDKMPKPVERPAEEMPPIYRGGSTRNRESDPIKTITISLVYIFLFVIL